MSLYDFFFPEQAQASHLRKLAEGSRSSRRRARQERRTIGELEKRIDDLEQDLGFVSLLLASMMAKLDESGTLSRADLKAAMQELDSVDGVSDGRLDISVLRGMQA